MAWTTWLAFTAVPLAAGVLAHRGVRDNALPVRTFCCTVAACVASVFQLILCEVLQTGDPRVRVLMWTMQTAALLVLTLVIAPLVQIWRLSIPRVLCPVAYGGYLALAYMVSLRIPLADRRDGSSLFALRQQALALVSLSGIATMALLCGVSSVSAPYAAFVREPPVSEVDAARLRASVHSIDEMAKAKELQISRLKLDVRPASPGMFNVLYGMVKPKDGRQQDLAALQQELKALQRLHYEVGADLASVQTKLARAAYYKTLRGRLHRLVFALFSLYCVYRVLNTYLRLGWYFFAYNPGKSSQGGPKDLLVLAAAQGIHHLVPLLDVDAWSRVVGVLTSGCVFCAALNGVLSTVHRVLRALKRAPASLLDPVLVAQIGAVYVIALASSLRFNLPDYMVAPIQHAIASPLDMASVQLLNDVVLGTASSFMIAVLFCVHRLNAQPFDEEMGAKLA